MPQHPPDSAKRLGFVDQFRGLATIFMIETHVYNALLMTSLETGLVYTCVNFVNGLVAPSFLFVSGFSFTLALNRKGEAYRRFSPQLFRHLRRLLFIWAVGYALHLPFFSLRKSLYSISPDGVLALTAVDILQCIAATLFLLHIIRVVVKDDRKFNLVLYFLFLFFVIAAPFVGSADFTHSLPLFFAQYFNRMHGSLFPIFPWSGFLIGGTMASEYLMKRADTDSPGKVKKSALTNLLLAGISLSVAGFILMPVEESILIEPHFAQYSPSWFFVRFGILLGILYGVTVYEGTRSSGETVVKLFGRESFFIYVLHLIIIYGSSANFPSLVNLIGPHLNYAGYFGAFVALSVVMYLSGRFWHNLKRSDYLASRRVQYLLVGIVLYLFISRPF